MSTLVFGSTGASVDQSESGRSALGAGTKANGVERGGAPFSRGHIYRLLSNPIYIGRIAHKGQLYPGQHPALLDDETWIAVQNQLSPRARNHRRRSKAAEPSLLAGLLVGDRGERLTPSHAVKKGRRYRYYISAAPIADPRREGTQGWRLAAQQIEDCVISVLVDALTSPARLLDQLHTPDMSSDEMRSLLRRAARLAAALGKKYGERAKVIGELVERVTVEEKRIVVAMRRRALLGGEVPLHASGSIELAAAVAFKRRGVATRMVLPGLAPRPHVSSKYDPVLVKAIARGRAWFEELSAGRVQSLQELALRDGITRRYIRRLVNLAFLSPQLVETIVQGRQSDELTATRLTELDLPLDWAEQHRLLAS